MNIKKYTSIAVGLVAFGSLALALPAFAAGPSQPNTGGGWLGWLFHGGQSGQATTTAPTTPPGGYHTPSMNTMKPPAPPAVVGTVSALDGDILTVSGRTGFGFGSTTPATSFTVDATNATIFKNNATSTIASVSVGDTVIVQGTVSGTDITATTVRDGVFARGTGMGPRMGSTTPNGQPGQYGKRTATSTPPVNPLSSIQGNGQPVIGGTISAISGTTLTVTNKSNVVYTVDASSAKIVAGQNTTATVSNLSVGDTVVIQGTVNGTAITASSIIDQAVKPAGTASSTPNHQPSGGVGGIFGGIGQFFSHLFGF